MAGTERQSYREPARHGERIGEAGASDLAGSHGIVPFAIAVVLLAGCGGDAERVASGVTPDVSGSTAGATASASPTASIALGWDGQVPRDACDHLGAPPTTTEAPGVSSEAAPPGPPSPSDEALRPSIDAVAEYPGSTLVDERTAVIAGGSPGITRTYCLPLGTAQQDVDAFYTGRFAGWFVFPREESIPSLRRYRRDDIDVSVVFQPQDRLLAVTAQRAPAP